MERAMVAGKWPRENVMYRCKVCRVLVEYFDLHAHYVKVHRVRVYGVDLAAQFTREVVS